MTRIILDELLTFSLPTVDADGVPTAATDVTLTVFDLGHPDGSAPTFTNGKTANWGTFYGSLSTGHQYVYVDALESNDFRPGHEYLIEALVEVGAATGFKGWRFKVDSNARFAKRSLWGTFAHAPDGGGDTSFDSYITSAGTSPRLIKCTFLSGGSGVGVLAGADGVEVLAADVIPNEDSTANEIALRLTFTYEVGVTTLGNFKTAMTTAFPGLTITGTDATVLDGTLVSNGDIITWENFLTLRATEYGTEWNNVSVFWDNDVTGGDEYISEDVNGWHIHYQAGVTEWDEIKHILRATDKLRLQSPTAPPAGGSTLTGTDPISNIITNGDEWVLGGGRGYAAEATIATPIDANVTQWNSNALLSGKQDLGIVRSNTMATGSTSTTAVLDAGASATDDDYNFMIIEPVSGTGADQGARLVTDYVQFGKTCTVYPPWTTTPDNTTGYVLRRANGLVPLMATVVGRTLDVTATGAAGIDWSNIENQATSVLLSQTVIEAIDYIAGANAIDSTTLAASAIAEIADGVLDELLSGHTIAGSLGKAVSDTLAAVDTEVATVVSGVADIQARLPAALVGGRMDSSVGAMQADVMTAAATAADYVTELQSGLATAADLATVDTVVDAIRLSQLVTTNTAQVSSTTGYIVLAVADTAFTDAYRGCQVRIKSGTGALQVRTISSYLSGSQQAFVVPSFAVAPDDTSVYEIYPGDSGISSGGINSNSFLTDAIGSTALAPSAITEIQAGLATAAALTTVDTVVDAILVDTAALDARLPTDPADASDVAALIDALPTAAEIDTQLSGTHGAGSWSGDDAATIVAALMAHGHDTGVTVLGILKRLEALVSGKATGLNGTTARFYLRDGVTVAIEAVQDVDAGTRATADVTGSE